MIHKYRFHLQIDPTLVTHISEQNETNSSHSIRLLYTGEYMYSLVVGLNPDPSDCVFPSSWLNAPPMIAIQRIASDKNTVEPTTAVQ